MTASREGLGELQSFLEGLTKASAQDDVAALVAARVEPVVQREPEMWLARAAVPRWLDAPVYTMICGDVTGAPPFESLGGREGLEYAGRERWRVAPDLRRKILSAQGEPRLDAELAGHFAGREPPEDLEALYHRLASEPAAAGEEVEQQLRIADAGFRLGRCGDLLAAVEERNALRPIRWAPALLRRWRPYVATRARYRTEWEGTRTYRRDDRAASRFEGHLGEPQKWILQVNGTGGMGKSMFLWWLIAERCVPRRVPVARIDFVSAEKTPTPWAHLEAIVEQLAAQRADGTLQSLAFTLGEELKRHRQARWTRDAASLHEEARRFFAELGRGQGDPTVILLDTTEVPLHDPSFALDELVGLLARYRERGIELVLAGRQDLFEKGRPLERVPAAERDTIRLEPFDSQAARSYLLETWGLRDDERIPIILERSGRIPLLLALYGEAVCGDPRLDAAELRRLPGPDLTYLIERILLQIDGVTRWLLVYGVAPRLLTRDFVAAVALPYLAAALRGERVPPATKELVARGRPVLAPEPRGKVPDLDEVWSRIARYAATSSWVHLVDATTLEIHPEVSRPMRALLRDDPVYDEVHDRAASWSFQHAAAADPAARGTLLAEGLYHVLHRDPAAVGRVWREWCRDVVGADVQGRRQVAASLLGGSFRDEEGRSLLDGETLREVVVEHKLMGLYDPAAAGGPRFLDELARGGEPLAVRAGASEPEVQIVLASSAGTVEAWAPLAELPMPAPLAALARVELARALRGRGRIRETVDAYERFAHRHLASWPAQLLEPVAIETAGVLFRYGRHEAAIAATAVADTPGLRFARAQLLMEGGQFVEADHLLAASDASNASERRIERRLRAELQVRRGTPDLALADWPEMDDGAADDEELFREWLLRGIAMLQLGDREGAMKQLSRAIERAAASDRPSWLIEGRWWMFRCSRELGEETAALKDAFALEALSLPDDHPDRGYVCLARAEVATSRQQADAALEALLHARDVAGPVLTAHAALTGLRWGSRAMWGELLVDALAALPPATRLAALGDLTRYHGALVPHGPAANVVELASEAAAREPVLMLRAAQLADIAGMGDVAARFLGDAVSMLDPRRGVLAVQALQLARRLREPGIAGRLIGFLDRYASAAVLLRTWRGMAAAVETEKAWLASVEGDLRGASSHIGNAEALEAVSGHRVISEARLGRQAFRGAGSPSPPDRENVLRLELTRDWTIIASVAERDWDAQRVDASAWFSPRDRMLGVCTKLAEDLGRVVPLVDSVTGGLGLPARWRGKVSLWLEDPILCSIPWELGFEGDVVRVTGPRDFDAWRRRQQHLPSRPRPQLCETLLVDRDEVPGYEALGPFARDALTDRDPLQALERHGRRAAVVLLAGRLASASTGEVGFLSPRGLLGATELAGFFRPECDQIIVLEAPRARDPGEVARQLVYRNALAAALLAHEAGAAVLALGPFGDERSGARAHELLGMCLESRADLGGTRANLAELARATALFTHHPGIRFFTSTTDLGRSRKGP